MRLGRVFALTFATVIGLSVPAFTVSPDDFDVVIRRNGMPNTFARLNGGQSATIAYIGGSVTEMTGWRDNVTNWFKGHYPGKITEVNAGWAGTGSAIGALRIGRDVVAHDPDLVFIEFAINDETGDTLEFIMQNYDGMVRQIWQHNPMTDICFIETIAWYIEAPYLAGNLPTTVDGHYRVADHYMIPSVNVGWALYQHVLAGTPWENLAPDRAHPNAAGHQIYSDAIIQLLDGERTAGRPASEHVVIAPKTNYPIDGCDLVELGEITLPSGWTRGTGMGVNSFAQSSQQNAEITLNFSGPIAVLKFIKNPDGGLAGYSIDGAPFTSIDLTHDWTWVWALPIGKMLDTGSHSVRLRVLSSSGVVRLVNFESSIPYTGSSPTPTPSSLPGSSLALNQPATVSSAYSASYDGTKAVDGQVSTKWASATGQDEPHTLTVDLGQLSELTGFIAKHASLSGDAAFLNAYAYKVEVSQTGSGDWQTAAIVTNSDSASTNIYAFNPTITGRYVRYTVVNANATNFDHYARQPEFEVWGYSQAPSPTPAPTPGGNLSEGRPAYASTSYSGDFGPENAVDGLIDGINKWCSTGVDPSWWYVDLGAPYPLSEVKVYAAGSGGEAAYMNLQVYTVRASNSAATTPDNWTILASYNSGGSDGADMVSHNVSGSYRYVGIHITDSGIDAYSRVPEVQVFGGGPAPTNTPVPTPTDTPVPVPTDTPVSTSTPVPSNTPVPTNTIPPGTNLAEGRPAYASTSYSGDFGPDNAVDGLIDGINKWCSTGVDPSWWYVDLGAPYPLSEVKVYAAGSGGEAAYMNLQIYTVRASNSAATTPDNWTILASYNSGGSDGADMVSHNVSGSYRYVGIHITDSGIDAYSRVPEVQVFGGGASPTNTPGTPPTSTPTPEGPFGQEDFETMPNWSSTYNASWGSAAVWSIVPGGQSGNYLKASRSSEGSSARVMVYNVPSNTSITVSCYMRCPYFGGGYWAELGYKLGSHTAENFDQYGGTWNLIRKFDSYGAGNGNGDTWVNYSAEVDTGSNTQISIGFKLGSSGGGGPDVGWDTLRIEESQGYAGGPLFRVLQIGCLRPGDRRSLPG